MAERETWIIEARDTVYFGGGLPFVAGESGFLPSRFPPTPLVMQGVVRTALLTGHNVDWQEYYEGRCSICRCAGADCAVLRATGSAGRIDDLGLDLRGPFLAQRNDCRSWSLLYPTPADLVALGGAPTRLRPGEAVECDLGRIKLPTAILPSTGERGPRLTDYQGTWITATGLRRHLNGQAVSEADILPPERIFSWETRVGIGRNRATRVAEDRKLYSLGHCRLAPGFALAEQVANLPKNAAVPSMILLGGEKRLAYISRQKSLDVPVPTEAPSDSGFRMIFLTPGKWTPPAFSQTSELIPGLTATLVSACLPKTERIGGWNMAAGKGHGSSRAMETVIPAGSVFFFLSDLPVERIFELLGNSKIGAETKLGFGHVAVGVF